MSSENRKKERKSQNESGVEQDCKKRAAKRRRKKTHSEYWMYSVRYRFLLMMVKFPEFAERIFSDFASLHNSRFAYWINVFSFFPLILYNLLYIYSFQISAFFSRSLCIYPCLRSPFYSLEDFECESVKYWNGFKRNLSHRKSTFWKNFWHVLLILNRYRYLIWFDVAINQRKRHLFFANFCRNGQN